MLQPLHNVILRRETGGQFSGDYLFSSVYIFLN
jgi:hypothetical protein